MKSSKPPRPAPRQSQENGNRPQLPARPKRDPVRSEDVKASSNQAQLDVLRDFALRKNFTEAEFEEAVKRTTNIEDTNLFFSHLIAVAEDYGPKEYVGFNHSSSRRRPQVVEGLRNIVIDGSNVAMT